MTSHYMPKSFISERFDELTTKQQLAINDLIRTLASHSLSFDDCDQAKRIKDVYRSMEQLGDAAIERPVRVAELVK